MGGGFGGQGGGVSSLTFPTGPECIHSTSGVNVSASLT